jgi:hypothetical protein
MALVTPSARPRCAAALPLLVALSVCTFSAGALAQEIIDDGYVPGYSMDSCGSQCNDGGCGGFWIGAEYLRWRIDGASDLPPLLTDGPVSDGTANAGQLDNPNTEILFGDETVNEDWRGGYRIYGGAWLDCCQCWGIYGDYFDLCDADDGFISGSSADRIVTRPFFNTETGEDDTQLVDVPNELEGRVRINTGDDFSGGGIGVQHCLWKCCDPCGCGPSSQGYLLAGYRHYEYDSDLVITENLTVLPGTTTPLVPGTTIFLQDSFRTENEFNGGEIGFQGFVQRSCWWLDGLAKFAVGSHRRTVTIDGSTVNTVPNVGSAEFVGGLLTSEATNIGEYSDNSLAIIPEFRLGVGTQLTNNVSVRAGYNVIIWNSVARAGSQLPPGLEVDPRNLPPVQAGGGADPDFVGILGSPLIAHGFDLGVQFVY